MDHIPCPRCHGTGKDPNKTGAPSRLPADPARPGEVDFTFDVRCELCHGSGYVAKGVMMRMASR